MRQALHRGAQHGPDDVRLEPGILGPELHRGHGEQHQAELKQVDFGAADDDAAQRRANAVALEGAAIGDHRGVAGEQHEHLGGVAQAVGMQRHVVEQVGRHVVGEDHQQSGAAHDVHPRITHRRPA